MWSTQKIMMMASIFQESDRFTGDSTIENLTCLRKKGKEYMHIRNVFHAY